VPTYITSVVTVYPTTTAKPTTPVGTASGAMYPTSSVLPFTGGAAAKQAGGLLMVAGIAAALL
jgi:hypothetical protein